MPFVSKAQRAKAFATGGFGGRINLAEWESKTPKKLPKHVKPKKK